MIGVLTAFSEIPEHYADKLLPYTAYGNRLSYDCIINLVKLMQYFDDNSHEYNFNHFVIGSFNLHLTELEFMVCVFFDGRLAIGSLADRIYATTFYNNVDDIIKIITSIEVLEKR